MATEFLLVIIRPGYHDDGSDLINRKPYTYEAAAINGFDKAVFNHGRLASDIVLYQCDVGVQETVNTSIREWHKAPPAQPNFLYSFVDLIEEEMNRIARDIPSLASGDTLNVIIGIQPPYEDDDLVTWTPAARAELMANDVGLLNIDEHTGRVPAIVLPNWDSESGDGNNGEGVAEITLHLVALFKKRYGRYPHILQGQHIGSYGSYSLLDLNEVL